MDCDTTLQQCSAIVAQLDRQTRAEGFPDLTLTALNYIVPPSNVMLRQLQTCALLNCLT